MSVSQKVFTFYSGPLEVGPGIRHSLCNITLKSMIKILQSR